MNTSTKLFNDAKLMKIIYLNHLLSTQHINSYNIIVNVLVLFIFLAINNVKIIKYIFLSFFPFLNVIIFQQ